MKTALREFPCPVCGSVRYRILYPDTLGDRLPRFDYKFGPEHTLTYRIVKCAECGHGYASPRPENIWAHYRDVEDSAYLGRKVERIATAARVVEQIRRYMPAGRLLDVGCATGEFLDAAREYYEGEGLELSAWSAGICRARGFLVHTCTLGDLQIDRRYDALTLWGVIEHFEYPAQEVSEIGRLLKVGGIVALWTGDVDSWISRLLGKRYWYVQGQHIQMFSYRSLRKVFLDRGFKVLAISRYPYVMSMGSISESLARYPMVGWAARCLLRNPVLSGRLLTLTLPGEMFAIFQKVK
jgi:SAM-dependent methyltransferase